MAMASESLHESADVLKPETIDRHRAVSSIMEELEAVDWYDQRVDATHDEELRAILAHNRDEEKEHAAMVLEWLRRRDPALDSMLRQYLFIETPVLEREAELDDKEASANRDTPAANRRGSLEIGSLKPEAPR